MRGFVIVIHFRTAIPAVRCSLVKATLTLASSRREARQGQIKYRLRIPCGSTPPFKVRRHQRNTSLLNSSTANPPQHRLVFAQKVWRNTDLASDLRIRQTLCDERGQLPYLRIKRCEDRHDHQCFPIRVRSVLQQPFPDSNCVIMSSTTHRLLQLKHADFARLAACTYDVVDRNRVTFADEGDKFFELSDGGPQVCTEELNKCMQRLGFKITPHHLRACLHPPRHFPIPQRLELYGRVLSERPVRMSVQVRLSVTGKNDNGCRVRRFGVGRK